jgi:hypothetical protein
MEAEILYWHWIVLGFALMISEIFLTTFFILWFGAAAIIVGALLFFVPSLQLSVQILIWTSLSALMAWGWYKYLRPLSIDKTKAGLSMEAIVGETGQVLTPPNGELRGKVRFSVPILGSDEWMIISEEVLAIGVRVAVVDISGNSLIVKKV